MERAVDNCFDTHILVSGNGFDIQHGYETGYKDFVNWTKHLDDCTNPFIKYFQTKMDSSAKKEEYKWIDCEAEIAQVVDSFYKITSRIEEKPKGYLNYNEAGIKPRDSFVYKCFPNYITIKDKGVKVNNMFKNSDIGVYEKQRIITSLLQDLNGTASILKTYLWEATNGEVFTVFGDTVFDYVINFNYTTTYRKYISDENKVFNVHGSLGYEEGNIVFGISDDKIVSPDYLES